jgi:CPA2 family monovalent cation:H+ antiporter-2
MVLQELLVPPLVRDLAVILAAAAAIVLVFHKLRLPLVVGYLFAGMLMGPLAPTFGYVSDVEAITTIADLGVILLIFTIGLEFNLKKLRMLGLRILLIGTLEVFLMFIIGYWAAILLGWRFIEAVYLGAIISIAGTTVVVKSLIDAKKLNTEQGQLVVGILIIEDLAVVILLTILSGLSGAGGISAADILLTVGRMVLFAFVSIASGVVLVPRLVDYVARAKVRELLVITILGLCFGMALFSAILGFTPAVGAFVMGVLVAEARRSRDVLESIEPLRDLFIALFFISMGMLIDLTSFLSYIVIALVLTLVFILSKATVVSLTSALLGTGGRTSIRVGISMLALGEFSLLIAKLGQQDLGVVRDFLYPVTATMIIVTALLVPYTIRASDSISMALFKRLPLWMREYALFLPRWSDWASRSMRRATKASSAVREDVITFLVGIALVAFVGSAAWLVYVFQVELSQATGLPSEYLLAGAGIAFVIGSFWPFTRVLRSLGHLMRVTTGAMVEASPSARAVGFQTIHKVLLMVISAVVLLVGGLTASILLASLVTVSPLLLVVIVAASAVAIILLWDALRVLHRRLEETFARGLPSEQSDETEGQP